MTPQLISASYKTDIPAYYGRWFLNRLDAGWCHVVNPYSGKTSHVALDHDSVSGLVLWTRNPRPFRDGFAEIARRRYPFMVHVTLTGYPAAFEPQAGNQQRIIDDIRHLSDHFGSAAVVWRYDPIVFSSLTDAAWHRRTFATLCSALTPLIDEVVVSFLQPYAKTVRGLTAATARWGFHWHDPEPAEKQLLLGQLATIAAEHGIRLSLCGQPQLLLPGVAETACIDLDRLSRIAGRALSAPRRPHRPTCGCWQSRDIGDYDSCQLGCVYCYAVQSAPRVAARRHRHDPEGPWLIPPNDPAESSA